MELNLEYTLEFEAWFKDLDDEGQGIVDGFLRVLEERRYLGEPFARTEPNSTHSPKLWVMYPAHGDRSFRVYYLLKDSSVYLILGFDALASLAPDVEVRAADIVVDKNKLM